MRACSRRVGRVGSKQIGGVSRTLGGVFDILSRGRDQLQPWPAIHIASGKTQIQIALRLLICRQRASNQLVRRDVDDCQRLKGGPDAQHSRIKTPFRLDDTNASEHGGGVTVSAELSVVGAALLQHDLKPESVVGAPGEVSAEGVAAIVAGVDVGPRLRGDPLWATPRSHQQAEFVGTTFNHQFLERCDRELRQLSDACAARIERFQLDPVEEEAHPRDVPVVCSDLRRHVVARAQRGQARHTVEEVGKCQGTGREEAVAIPSMRHAGLGEKRDLGLRERADDGIGARDGVRALFQDRVSGCAPLCAERRGDDGRHQGHYTNPPGLQLILERTNSTNVPTGRPVGPFGNETRSFSE